MRKTYLRYAQRGWVFLDFIHEYDAHQGFVVLTSPAAPAQGPIQEVEHCKAHVGKRRPILSNPGLGVDFRTMKTIVGSNEGYKLPTHKSASLPALPFHHKRLQTRKVGQAKKKREEGFLDSSFFVAAAARGSLVSFLLFVPALYRRTTKTSKPTTKGMFPATQDTNTLHSMSTPSRTDRQPSCLALSMLTAPLSGLAS